MDQRDVLAYYSRKDVQEFLLNFCKGREVAGVFASGAFSERPNVLKYPGDIMHMVREGVVAFHGSVERWSNPMNLKSDVDYNDLRAGWELILDFDCEQTDHGKVAAKVFRDVLAGFGVSNISLKFTGGTGFHLGVPWESIPEKVTYDVQSASAHAMADRPKSRYSGGVIVTSTPRGKKYVSPRSGWKAAEEASYISTAQQFPELGRRVLEFLKLEGEQKLREALLEKWSMDELAAAVGRPVDALKDKDMGLNPYKVVGVDSVLISPRHLFRLPYSLHEKSGLVSLPFKFGDLDSFSKEHAFHENVKVEMGFLGITASGSPPRQDDAAKLFTRAIEWAVEQKKFEQKTALETRGRSRHAPTPCELFPPCIKNILNGLSDGRKRALFILTNFLRTENWEQEAIEVLLKGWNERNNPHLPESLLANHLRSVEKKPPVPPPNCVQDGWYEDFEVCKPDETCGQNKGVKNPVTYPAKLREKYYADMVAKAAQARKRPKAKHEAKKQ